MAKQNQSKSILSLDRRQLLVTAATATVTMAGVIPTELTETAMPAEAAIPQAPLPVSHPSALKVCAATARRIEEIVARNRIRQQARLPPLSIPKELRRMKAASDTAAFDEFAARHGQEVWNEVLAPVREAKEQPTWRPTGWMEGMAFQTQVNKILWDRFQIARS